MRRGRRRRREIAVTLFPFLSVLACVIGVLTFLLAVLAIQRLDGPSLERIELAARLQALQATVAAGEAKLEALRAQLREAEERARAEDEMGERLAALGLSVQIPLEELADLVSLAREAAEIEAERKALAARHAALERQVEAREAELADRRAAQGRAPIIIDPTGLGPRWQPYLIECTADYLEFHDATGEFSVRIPDEEIAISEDYRRYLRRARVIQDAIVIFMIRPDGVDTCDVAVREADQHRVRHARLPLPGDGEIDFSALGKAR